MVPEALGEMGKAPQGLLQPESFLESLLQIRSSLEAFDQLTKTLIASGYFEEPLEVLPLMTDFSQAIWKI